MNNAIFQLSKVRKTIRVQGKTFLVTRPGKNEFGEPNGETESHEITGVYHELTEYRSKTTSEASTIRQRSSPMILLLWEDAKELHHQDKIEFNDKSYRVNEIKNLAEANLIADVSLEEVQT